ncbi:37S ribosomal protein RSM18 [Escovopsis weberi]|uniref:Small ribosomal subunit protein bS18m n=1 Tax=Escovopsis weberi TaxID=150374 RepID=A0A0M9VXD3_ESCWE|nr:37S ribosomal protein RSM18 [Escovopsis weberi]
MPLRPAPRALRAPVARALSTTPAPSSSAPTPRPSYSSYSSSSSSSSSKDLFGLGSNRRSTTNNNRSSNYNRDSNRDSSLNSRSGRPSINAGEAASRLLNLTTNRWSERAESVTQNKLAHLELLKNVKNSNDYLKQMPRRWDAGDVYSPHDMSPVEMQKWRKRSPRRADVVDALGLRPLDMYKNFSLVQEFTSSSGQIIHSQGTSLRPVNQRKIAKMIRRVQGMGLYPTIHDHPEMLRERFFPTRR